MPEQAERQVADAVVRYLPRFVLEWAARAPEEQVEAVAASLVLADISGFTALSERLARRGRQGAEELTSVLGTCFAAMLDVVHEAGGSLVKFGGDALLLLFEGDGHAERACASAWQMRALLAGSGKVVTSAGSVRLRMSVGVHSGTVHVFRVGSSHREILVTGPGATAVVEMEAQAAPGEIVISSGTGAQVHKRWLGGPVGTGFLLRSPRGGVPQAAGPVGPSGGGGGRRELDLTPYLPTALRPELVAGSAESEHRYATIGFLHFGGVDELLAEGPPEVAAGVLDELVARVQDAVDEEGITFLGSDVDGGGGKIIVVAGAPRTRGDDTARLLRALHRVVSGPSPLPLRAGVHRGHVFLGEVGPPARRTYTVMGDAVNLAARVMSRAERGQVLATRESLDHTRAPFEAEPLPPFRVKGKTEPVEAFAVGRPLTRRGESPSYQLPFLGRAPELERLCGLLDAAREGRGGVVEVVGAAGIGKSRLVEEARSAAADLPAIRAFCESYESRTPYFAFRFLLRGLAGCLDAGAGGAERFEAFVAQHAPGLAEWLPLLADVAQLDVAPTAAVTALDPRFRRERTRAAVGELLRQAITRPTLLVIEDAQWLDEPSRALLHELAPIAEQCPWVVCAVRRDDGAAASPDEGSGPAGRVLPVGPLPDAAAHELVTVATRRDPLLPSQRDDLVARAGGSPLFLEQLLRARAALGGTQLPDSLEAVIAADIDRLGADDRRHLRYAAVLGATFETDVLSAVLETDAATGAELVLRLRRFLEPAGERLVRFRNECYRQVAYETLPFRRRRELHARAGEALAGRGGDRAQERAGALSYHFLYAQRYEESWTYARMAAEQARLKYANLEAADLYERAVEAGTQVPGLPAGQLAETWELLGDVAFAANDYSRAARAFGQARRLGSPVVAAGLCGKRASVALREGRPGPAAAWIRRGLRLLEGGDSAEHTFARANLEASYAQVLQHTGRPREAARWSREAIRDGMVSQNRRALALGYSMLDCALVDLGRPQEAVHTPLSLEIWQELGELGRQAQTLITMGFLAFQQGRWDEAVRLHEQGREVSARAGNLADAATGALNAAEILLMQGREEAAEPNLQEALGLFRAVRQPYGVAEAAKCLAVLAIRRGELRGAREHLGEARQALAAVGVSASTELDALQAECQLREGDARAALLTVDTALRREAAGGGTTFVPQLRRLRGCVGVALRRWDDAWSDLDTALDVARTRGATYEVALTLQAREAAGGLAGREPDPAAREEIGALLSELGVVATVHPPLPQGTGRRRPAAEVPGARRAPEDGADPSVPRGATARGLVRKD